MATTTSWISQKAGRAGGDACVRDTRISIWGLEAYRRLGMSDAEIVSATPGLTSADLEAAWEYVASHRSEIDKAIGENEAGEPGFVE